MRQAAAPRTATRGTLTHPVLALVVVSAGIIGTLVYQAWSAAAPFSDGYASGLHPVPPQSEPPSATSSGAGGSVDHGEVPIEAVLGGVTEDDGVLPAGVTVFDDQYPGVADLDPDLLSALRKATRAAAGDGIELYVTSGWRSPAYQDQLLREAVSKYGSEAAAARWVATADTSPHVSGDAVDIGSSVADRWLSMHGASLGLCQIYRNEPWHFELRPRAIQLGCPHVYADPTHDPRMRR